MVVIVDVGEVGVDANDNKDDGMEVDLDEAESTEIPCGVTERV